MSEADLDLVRGTLDVLILQTLAWGPRHGYAILRWLEERSGDELHIEDGALYPALHRLERRGLIRGEWGLSENSQRVKEYSLTPAGRRELRKRVSTWQRYVAVLGRVLRSE